MEKLGRVPERFTTDMDVLDSASITENCLYPSGFIFHAGRCGSTLLSKAIATSREHYVLGEPAPSNLIWTTLTEEFRKPVSWIPQNRLRYKHLTLAQGRRRLPGYNRFFIKFTSYNILFIQHIRSAFPDVPAVFLYRRPAAIVASYLTGLPGWWRSPQIKALAAGCSEEDLSRASDLMVAEKVVLHYFSAALQAEHPGMRYLDYGDLTPAVLPEIVNAFNTSLPRRELDAAARTFRYDSTVNFRAHSFDRESRYAQKRQVAGAIDVAAPIQSLYERLKNSPQLSPPDRV
jgi:hypothetical protein